MILTDNLIDAQWFTKARSNGRDITVDYRSDRIDSLGWNFSMTPEQGSRGLQLLESLDDRSDLNNDYPDLRLMPLFQSQNVDSI